MPASTRCGIKSRVRIHSITLETRDPAGQAAFWSDTLGLPVEEVGDGVVEVSLHASTIRFERARPGTDPRYHFAINVPRGSIDEAAEWLSHRHELLAFHDDPDVEEGATIVHTDRGASALYFLDGGGNGDGQHGIEDDPRDDAEQEPRGHREHHDPRADLRIADRARDLRVEIGLATADTDATRAAVQEALGAEILWGGGEGWLLTAIGDDHGVVIVAPTGRGWIPIGLPAQPYPTTIVAAGPRERDLTLPEGPYRIRAVPE